MTSYPKCCSKRQGRKKTVRVDRLHPFRRRKDKKTSISTHSESIFLYIYRQKEIEEATGLCFAKEKKNSSNSFSSSCISLFSGRRQKGKKNTTIFLHLLHPCSQRDRPACLCSAAKKLVSIWTTAALRGQFLRHIADLVARREADA